jgi:cytochrome c553
MKRIWPKLVILAILCSPIPTWAGNSVAPSIRNCTWCHGTGAQGYTVAPRLAGQRSLYIESQLHGYPR